MRQLTGHFDIDTLKISLDNSEYIPPSFLSEVSVNVWNKLIDSTKVKGGQVWNGSIYRMIKITTNEKISKITLGVTDFKTHYATSFVIDKLKAIPFRLRPNGMYVSAYIQTSDHKFMFGVKSDASIATNKINFIGGNLNQDEMKIKKTDDIFCFFKKELEEELGIRKDSVSKISGLSIFQGENLRVGVLLMCSLNQSSQEILNNCRLNFENKSLIFLDKDQMTPRCFPINANLNIIKTLPLFDKYIITQ